jgi:integrase
MAWSAKEKKPLRRSFKTLKEARSWRADAQVDLRRNQLNAPGALLLEEAAEHWVAGARAGVIRTRSGEPYKPSAIRGYERALRRVILPALGRQRVTAITRNRVQDLIDELTASHLKASTVHNTFIPLRAILRRAVEREEIAVNPMDKVSLPKDRAKRDRVAEPREVEALLAVLPPRYRILWATAAYTGLRRGELQALRWESVELDTGVLRVVNSWDRVAGLVSPKSLAGVRTVPVPAILAIELQTHRLRQGCGGEGYVFSVDGEKPFDPSNALRAAQNLWAKAGLRPIGFHELRHSYASFMIAAGVNAKALSQYMGHSSITVTLDRYGHLMPGSEKEAADLLDGFLERDRNKHLRAVA